jgi:hypothetical protein
MKNTERRRIMALAVASLVMLPVATGIRLASPSPFAPRVHVRWAAGIPDDQRGELERRFSLVEGRQRDAETWEYDLLDVSPTSVQALIADPRVTDTHYLDRARGEFDAAAPPGTVRLSERRVAAWVHSPLFDLFTIFWVSSLIVSAVWLANPPDPVRR